MYQYLAQKGDSLESISCRFNIPLEWLCLYNPYVTDPHRKFRRPRVIIVPFPLPPVSILPFPPQPYPQPFQQPFPPGFPPYGPGNVGPQFQANQPYTVINIESSTDY